MSNLRIDYSGDKFWENEVGQYHREDGPAVKLVNGYQSWWLNGKRHRINGPAVEYTNGGKEWFLDNYEYTEEDYNEKVKEYTKPTVRLWLDDVREAPEGWIRCYWPADVIKYLKSQTVDEISLDHDLGECESTGYDVVLWLAEQVFLKQFKFHLPKMYCHSDNPVGRKKILDGIESIQKYSQSKEDEF